MDNTTGSVNAILIGSRAWNKEWDNENSSSKADWDLIITAERLSDLLHGRSFYHYQDQLNQGKLSVIAQNGAKVEFEIMEKFESANILKLLSKEQKKTIKLQNISITIYTGDQPVSRVWSVDTGVPSKEALLVLKASHIYFPINWRKNFLQLVSMMSSFPKSFSKVIKEDPHSSLLKELFQTRARETLHRVKSQVSLSVQRAHSPTLDQLRDSCKGIYDIELKFTEMMQAKEDPSDTFYLPTTGLKLSKSAWSKYGQDVVEHTSGEVIGKALIVYEQLILLALHYYLPQQRSFGFLSNLKREDQINELFMLCIETFVTQQLVPVTRVTDHHPEYKSHVPVSGPVIAGSYIYSIDLYETLPLASNSDLVKTTFANPMVNWLLDNINTEYDNIRTAFASFMRSCSESHKDLFAYKQFTVHLPFEIVEMIKSSVPDDHVLLAKLCRVCKSWNKYFSDDAKWEALCDRFDKQTVQLAKKNIAQTLSHLRCTWKLVFKHVLEVMETIHNKQFCQHCGNFHDRLVSYKERNDKVDEAYSAHCACPKCDAGSWRDCPYYMSFFYS